MVLLRQRRPNRLKNYDYSKSGYYFVTICTKGRTEYFGDVVNRKMILNKYGKIANDFWLQIPKHFNNASLDEYIVMPNHIHGIIIICGNIIPNVGNADLRSLQKDVKINNRSRTKMLLSKIIHGFKSSVSRNINMPFAWQKSFYDHIIRNEKSLDEIRQYIKHNVVKWEDDKNNIENVFM